MWPVKLHPQLPPSECSLHLTSSAPPLPTQLNLGLGKIPGRARRAWTCVGSASTRVQPSSSCNVASRFSHQLCVILEPMQELMSRHKTYNLSPRDCLKTCLFQKWQRMVAPPGRKCTKPTLARRMDRKPGIPNPFCVQLNRPDKPQTNGGSAKCQEVAPSVEEAAPPPTTTTRRRALAASLCPAKFQ